MSDHNQKLATLLLITTLMYSSRKVTVAGKSKRTSKSVFYLILFIFLQNWNMFSISHFSTFGTETQHFLSGDKC